MQTKVCTGTSQDKSHHINGGGGVNTLVKVGGIRKQPPVSTKNPQRKNLKDMMQKFVVERGSSQPIPKKNEYLHTIKNSDLKSSMKELKEEITRKRFMEKLH